MLIKLGFSQHVINDTEFDAAVLSSVAGGAAAFSENAGQLLSRVGLFSKSARIEAEMLETEGAWQPPNEAVRSMSASQAKNLQRFLSKLPRNSENIRVKTFLQGSKVFQVDSPAANIPGSFARYEKQIDESGGTVLYTKTTFGSDGRIIHIARKFHSGSKIYPEIEVDSHLNFTQGGW